MFIVSDNLDRCIFGLHTLPEFPKPPLGWLFPRNSILKPLFDRFFLWKKEHGVIQKLYDDQYKHKTECTDEPFNAIDFQTVALLFALLSVGLILAIISFAVERYLWTNGTFGDKFTEKKASSVKNWIRKSDPISWLFLFGLLNKNKINYKIVLKNLYFIFDAKNLSSCRCCWSIFSSSLSRYACKENEHNGTKYKMSKKTSFASKE